MNKLRYPKVFHIHFIILQICDEDGFIFLIKQSIPNNYACFQWNNYVYSYLYTVCLIKQILYIVHFLYSYYIITVYIYIYLFITVICTIFYYSQYFNILLYEYRCMFVFVFLL